MSEPYWVPLSGAATEIPTPVNGKWLKGGPGGAMTWEDLPTPPTPPGLITPDTAWKVVGVDVPYENGWTSYGAPYGPGRFRKLASGLVVMDGLISGGTVYAVAFTLPVGYRPTLGPGGVYRDLIFQSAVGGTLGYESARLNSSGGLVPYTAAASGWLSLVGVTFYAE